MKISKKNRFTFLFSLGILICNFCTAQKNIDALDKAQLFEKTNKEYQSFELAHGHSIQTKNVNMHFLTWGDPNGLPFVWVHGTGSNSYEIINFVDSILALGCYLIAIDFYGHGQTPIPKKEVSVYHVADDIKCLIDSLGLDKVLIGGWSRGGTISTAFYDAYRENTLGMVLEDGGSVNWRRPYHKIGLDSTTAKLRKMFPASRSFPSFDSQEEAFFHYFNTKEESSQFRLLNSIRKSSTNKWSRNPGLSEWLEEDSVDGMIRALFTPTLSPFFQYSTLNLEPHIIYRNLNVPLLICDPRREGDWFMDFTEANKALAERHPELVTHIIYENTSHAVKLRRPEKFIKDLSQFVHKVKQYHEIN